MARRKPTYTEAERIAAINAPATEDDNRFNTFDDGTVYLPEVRRTSYAMNPALLCCALFGINKGARVKDSDGKVHHIRQYIESTFETTNGATIEYRGKELSQDDLTVLLGLLQLHAGKATSCEFTFAPTTFCSRIGWSDSHHNLKRLKACLLRLRGALLIVRAKKNDAASKSKLALAIGTGWTLGFLLDFKWEGLERWSVQVDHRIGQLFSTAPTYLIAARRKGLTEGLQTWLYGFIEANTCTYALPLKTIHEACGSSAELKEFARQLRDALPKLIAVRALREGSTVKNGKVALFKVPSAKPVAVAAKGSPPGHKG